MFPGSRLCWRIDYRRSYVLWKENVPPTVLIEYASDDGEKERDTATPRSGKFWVYEQAVRGPYYAIFIVATGELEVYRLRNGTVSTAPAQRPRALSHHSAGSCAGRLAWTLWKRDGSLAPLV